MRTPAELAEALGISFSDEQLAAITAPLSPGVIIAGAGSGKTTVMAARVVWLVGTGQVQPEEVLGLTFTRKAAAELSARVRAALAAAGVGEGAGAGSEEGAGEPVVMTYDAFAGRLVAEHGLRIGVDAEATTVSGATRFRLAGQVVRAAAGPFEHLGRLRPATVVERVLALDAEMSSHLVTAADLRGHAREQQLALAEAAPARGGRPYAAVLEAGTRLAERLELLTLVGDYRELKARLQVVEFGDQMALAARLAEAAPAVSTLLRRQFPVVLLDEYQDTSAAQARLLQALFSGAAAPTGRGHPVTAVGDPFQAIYGWRGAAASNILAFATDFPRADGTPAARFGLTVNRRSGQRILDVANLLAAPLRAVAAGAGQASGLEPADTRLVAPPSAGPGQVLSACFDSWAEEVGWLAEQVVGARESGRVAAWSDIAVLTRRNADVARVYAELSGRDVPAEIVGLGGLLLLPEVADVVATLSVLDDVTANADLVRLLTGPRWRIGPRDLALLGARARELTERGTTGSEGADPLLAALTEAVAEADPSELTSLADAVADPGPGALSSQARHRLGQLAAELAELRSHAGEPVLDLTRRVVAVTGLEVELLATPELARSSRRDQLAAFCDAVAGYADLDPDASLSGLLAYLRAELEHGSGLDQAVPSDADAVKLLTVHRAKGLEWELVLLPGLVADVFPSDRVTEDWVRNSAVVPAELRGDAASVPQLEEVGKEGFTRYRETLKVEARLAEDRLAYVAATRARRVLVASGHHWREDNVRPRRSSPYLEAVWAEAERHGGVLHDAPAPDDGTANPYSTAPQPVPWPSPLDEDAWSRRREAARLVAQARAGRPARQGRLDPVPGAVVEPLSLAEESRVLAWDADLERLLGEARRQHRRRHEIRTPSHLTASQVVRLHSDPAGFAADLARPMPRPPSPGARLGSRFHRWVEQFFGSGALLDDDEQPGTADVVDQADLTRLTSAFAAGQMAELVPRELELPFTTVVADQVLRGRIDAVFCQGDSRRDPADLPPGGSLVVDWKTGNREAADPWQLAVYRLAWAELAGVAPEQVRAAFYWVRSDTLEVVPDLPGAAELTALLQGRPRAGDDLA